MFSNLLKNILFSRFIQFNYILICDMYYITFIIVTYEILEFKKN